MSKPTIFGEEHFIDDAMINIIEERENAIDNFIFDEIEGIVKYELPMPKIIINRDKVKKWLILCSKLENIEHTELVDIATKKKFIEKDQQIDELKNHQNAKAVEALEKVKKELEFASNNNNYITARDDRIFNGICEVIDNLITEYGGKNG